MKILPTLKGPHDSRDFHDSSLIHLSYDPVKDVLEIVLSTPDPFDQQNLWMVELHGILRMEFESLGDGEKVGTGRTPPEIYDVYDDQFCDEHRRWIGRLNTLGIGIPENLHVVIFASSFLRGWGERQSLEGVLVVCRRVEIKPAAPEYSGQEFSRPRIPAGDD